MFLAKEVWNAMGSDKKYKKAEQKSIIRIMPVLNTIVVSVDFLLHKALETKKISSRKKSFVFLTNDKFARIFFLINHHTLS
jgi:hypothetical protein